MIVDAFLHYCCLLSSEPNRLAHKLEELVIEFAVFLMKISLVIIGVFQLFLQFNLLVDKLLVLEGQGLVLALSGL